MRSATDCFFFICRLAGGRRFLPGASLVQTEPCCHGKGSFSLFLSLRTSTDRSGLRYNPREMGCPLRLPNRIFFPERDRPNYRRLSGFRRPFVFFFRVSSFLSFYSFEFRYVPTALVRGCRAFIYLIRFRETTNIIRYYTMSGGRVLRRLRLNVAYTEAYLSKIAQSPPCVRTPQAIARAPSEC